MSVPVSELTTEIFLEGAYSARKTNGQLGQLNDEYPNHVYSADGLMLRSLYSQEWSKLIGSTGGIVPGGGDSTGGSTG